jgi:G patch domain-containing protein 2
VLEVAIDTAPCADPAASVPMYSYEVVGGIGLGFNGDDDAEDEEAGESSLHLGLGFRDLGNQEMEESEEASFVTPMQPKAKGRQNGGYISIGGVRIYSEDTSSPESEGMGDSDEESDSDYEVMDRNADVDSDDAEGDPDSDVDGSPSGSEEGLSIGDSSVDDDVVADYMEGIGGSEELLSGKWVAGMKLADSDDDEMDTDDDEDGFLKKGKEKLEGYALMRASEQYGMKRPNSAERRKGKSTFGMDWDRGLASVRVMGLEDVMMVKDVRMTNRSSKGAKVSSSSHLSRSWPNEGRKSKKYHSVPGIKSSTLLCCFSLPCEVSLFR